MFGFTQKTIEMPRGIMGDGVSRKVSFWLAGACHVIVNMFPVARDGEERMTFVKYNKKKIYDENKCY